MRAIGLAVCLVLIFPAAVAADGKAAEFNEFCPVQPTQPSLPDYVLEFGDKKIYFCCEPCIAEFKRDPRAYLKNVPQFEGEMPAELEGDLESGDTLLAQVNEAETRQHLRLFLLVSAGLLLFWWPVKCLLSRLNWRLSVRPRLAEVGVCLLLGSIFALFMRARALDEQVYQAELKDLLHFATYHDFGETPVPAKPPGPRRLKASFYRGNDERSPRLFNGGHYRTCTFHIGLCGEESEMLDHGDEVSGPLYVRLDIARAPHTPDFFWTPERMRKYFLTQRCDPFMGSDGPIADRVHLMTAKPMERWTARFPIGEFFHQAKEEGSNSSSQVNLVQLKEAQRACCNCDSSATTHYDGIIYVGEEFATKEKMVGARLHCAIQYDIHIREGRLDEQSDLWMGALYRTRKVLQWRLPLEQWFSHEPIPELPRPVGTSDPTLLGISDYVQPDVPADGKE